MGLNHCKGRLKQIGRPINRVARLPSKPNYDN